MTSLVAGAIAYGPKGRGNCTAAFSTSDLILDAKTANLGILRSTALPALGFGQRLESSSEGPRLHPGGHPPSLRRPRSGWLLPGYAARVASAVTSLIISINSCGYSSLRFVCHAKAVKASRW